MSTAIAIVYDENVATVVGEVSDDGLWLAPAELRRSTGWEPQAAGLCRGSACVPVPAARRPELLRPDGSVNLTAFAGHEGRAVVHDESRAVWVFGRSGAARSAVTQTLQAPDFELPDLDGRLYRLSDARGRKVLIASWASW